MKAKTQKLRRWRLALGRYGERRLGALSGVDGRRDAALGALYGRELTQRGVATDSDDRRGGLGASQLTAIGWLNESRKLFPQETFETLQGHAIERYGMTELLKDPQVLEGMRADPELLAALMALKGAADPAVAAQIRAIARRVVEELLRKLKSAVSKAFSGTKNRFERSHHKVMRNFDWRGTVRENLKTYDPERQALIPEQLRFIARTKRRLPWTVILCVDQSGSMASSVIHAAVMAAVLAGLPSLKLHLVVFDTAVVDLTDQMDDPVEVLMSVQLGGGTDIGKAAAYCETLVRQPTRTVFVLLSDFFEGAPVGRLLGAVQRLVEARVTCLGLAALDEAAQPDFDRGVVQRLAALGMDVAAMTPEHFAEWLSERLR